MTNTNLACSRGPHPSYYDSTHIFLFYVLLSGFNHLDSEPCLEQAEGEHVLIGDPFID